MTRRPPVQREKVVQAQLVNFLRSISAQVYVLGTRRPRGDFHGTCQTPGVPDLWVFLPPARMAAHEERTGLWIEVKAPGGRRSPDQTAFAIRCAAAHVPYVCGGVDELVAWLIDRGWIKAGSVAHYRQPEEAP
jgi:hypothetical protein